MLRTEITQHGDLLSFARIVLDSCSLKDAACRHVYIYEYMNVYKNTEFVVVFMINICAKM